jgi:signal transduction histidine kinase/ActR/RegA family two-component response regulator
VRTKGLIVVAVPLIALVATASASLAMQSSERSARDAGRHAFLLINAGNQILTDALNAETGVRGYAVTRDPAFLAPYGLALRRIGADSSALRLAARPEGDSAQAAAVLAQATRVFAGLAATRAAVSHGASANDLQTLLGGGKRSMDQLRLRVTGLTRGPTVALAARTSAINSLESQIGVLNTVGLALGLLAGLAGVALFTSGISRRVVRAGANAGRLGEGEPLRRADRSRDDIGRLNEALARAEKLLANRAADLIVARDEAVTATHVKNAFLSSTSHELRTPLNSILGFTQLLELSDLSEEDHDSVERILAAGRHLLALINELIDIARIESGELSLSIEPVCLEPLVAEACQLMAPLAAERAIRIASHSENASLAVRADRQRLSQVLVNLISNAVKYNRRGGAIDIACRAAGTGRVEVAVTDTGPGIPPGDMQRIFVPFDRLGAEQAGVEGTGIGLPLARTLTEAMHGELTAASEVGHGSSFTIALPRARDVAHTPPSPQVPAPAAAQQAHGGQGIRVLYIEDNPANVEVVSRFLRGRRNARLHAVPSGRAGIEHAMREVPDIILLDLHLPGLRGEQVLEELKSEPTTVGIPVVVLSAEASPRVIRRLLGQGAHAYLTKPLVLTELGALLDSYAGQQPAPVPGTLA